MLKKIPSVLIVDDSESDQEILQLFIEMLDVCEHIFLSNNGQEGIDFLRSYDEHKEKFNKLFPPSLILLDINMPVMNGFEFMEEFEKSFLNDERYNNVTIIFVSSSDYDKDKEAALSYKLAKDYVVKPFDDESIKIIWNKYFPF